MSNHIAAIIKGFAIVEKEMRKLIEKLNDKEISIDTYKVRVHVYGDLEGGGVAIQVFTSLRESDPKQWYLYETLSANEVSITLLRKLEAYHCGCDDCEYWRRPLL